MPEVTFDWAIVDEAGRATVPEVLIPMVKAKRAILVGDERQLPPFVDELLHRETDEEEPRIPLDTSLFQSLVEQAQSTGANCVMSLRTQYRMHPAIGRLISQVFYEGKLEDGQDFKPRAHSWDWIPSPVTWFTTSGNSNRSETRIGESYANPYEAEVIVRLLQKMESESRQKKAQVSVGVISGYSAQIAEIEAVVDPSNRERWRSLQIEIATVDSFQGQERDAVVYSTVRSNRDRRIGFLRDYRRINVALSRARDLLIIIGDELMMDHATLGPQTNPFAAVLQHIRSNRGDCSILRSDLVTRQ